MTDPAAVARALYDARTTRVPIAPLTETAPDMTPEDAYAIQASFVELLVGRRRRGRRVQARPHLEADARHARRSRTGLRTGAVVDGLRRRRHGEPGRLHPAEGRSRDRAGPRQAAAGARRHDRRRGCRARRVPSPPSRWWTHGSSTGRSSSPTRSPTSRRRRQR